MIAEATPICAVNFSLANSQPSKTATTGFTYAYVESSDTGALCSSHPYATKPTSEPNLISYNKPSHDFVETCARLKPLNSPLSKLTRNSATAPVNISIPVPSSVDLGMSAPRA